MLKQKTLLSLGLFIVLLFLFIPYTSSASMLTPGEINSCGELGVSGEYILTTDLVASGTSTCFFVSSDNVTISGNGHTVTGAGTSTGAVAIDARARISGPNSELDEAQNGYTNLIITNLTIEGFTTGINTSGNNNTTGVSVRNGNGGDGGDVAVSTSTVGSITTTGGNSTTTPAGGVGGNVYITAVDLNIANATFDLRGGTGLTTRNTDGGLDLNYTGTLTKMNVVLSTLSFFNDNLVEYGSYVGGSSWPISPGTISSCGILAGSGIYILSQDVTSSSTCFTISSNNITVDGNGFSIISATTSNTEFAVNVGSHSEFTLSSTTVTDYTNLINSSSSVTVSGNNINLSNKYINADTLNIVYTGVISYDNFSYSDLTKLVINNVDYGSVSSGLAPLLNFIWTQRTYDAPQYWSSVASDSTGTKLAAVVDNHGAIWTSVDGGVSWVERIVTGNEYLDGITSDASGTRLAACDYQGHIFLSSDSGVTWSDISNRFDGFNQFRSITSSSDGTKLAAVVDNGYIYTSSDSGNTWVQRISSGSRYWISITSSADGTKLAAVVSGGYIYTSTDSGNTWAQKTSDTTRNWYSITSDTSGTKLAAVVQGGYIYTSTDSGNTWVKKTSDATRSWNSITSSADGTKLAATVDGGYIYTSSDSGNTWVQSNTLSAIWYTVKLSYDGTKIFAGVRSSFDGYLYSAINPFPVQSILIASPVAGDVDDWSPKIYWHNSKSCYYSFDNWISTNSVNCSLGGSDIPRPGYGSNTLDIRGVTVDGTILETEISFTLNLPITVNNPFAGNIFSWNPDVDWNPGNLNNITTCLYSYDNWLSSHTSNCLLTGSDILFPPNEGINTLSLKVVDSLGNEGIRNISFSYAIPWGRRDSIRSWRSITSDASGTKLAAVVSGGYIYTSIDSGNTWVQKTSDATRNWYSITSDTSGTKLAAVVSGGYIYTSIDSGNTWVQKTSDATRSWISITSDASGTKLAAVVSNGYIYTSIDSGNTWVQKTTGTARYWRSITSDASGTKLAAVDFYGSNWSGGYIYTSSDSGNTWVQKTSSGARQWGSITSSSDGTKLAAVVSGGYIYTSIDSGNTWVQKTSDATRSWNSITSSADGTKLAAVVSGGYIYTSIDSGNTWMQKTTDTKRSWNSIALSADGIKLVALAQDDYIYIYNSESISVKRPVDGSTVFAKTWSMLVDWGSSVSCYYSYDNWTSSSTAGCMNRGSDILYPTIAGITKLYLRGFDILNNQVDKFFQFDFEPWIWNENGFSKYWRSITSDASGTKLAAVVSNGYIYTSIDSGNTWVQKTSDATRYWQSITSSADGTKLAAVVDSGYIYTSSDSGSTWVQKTSDATRRWYSITSSADGTKLAAVVSGGYIYTSIDSGNTWAQKTSDATRYWRSVTSDASGTKLAAVVDSGYIYTSIDSGNTWVQKTSDATRSWYSITSDADGTKLAAVVSGGYIYTSIDSGNTWAQKTSDATRYWRSVTSDASGTKLAAVVAYNYIYTSTDSGNTWVQKTSDTTRNWQSITSSSDGTKLAAVVDNSFIYTYSSKVVLTSPQSRAVSSWSPKVLWLNSIICQYSYDGVNWHNISCDGNGSEIPAPETSGSKTLQVKGIDFANNLSTSSVSFLYFAPVVNNSFNTCGTISSPGTYTLTSNITSVEGPCFVINSSNVTINGNGYTVTGIEGNTDYAIDSGNFSNLNLQNISFAGFGAGLVRSNSSVTYSGENIDLSNSTSSIGSLTINYTSTLTTLQTYFSSLTNLVINSMDLFSFTAGLFSWSQQNISSCGTISNSGIYRLTQDITAVSGTCFNITSSYVIIDGNGHSITSVNGNTNYAFVSASSNANAYSGVGIKNLTLIGFGGGVNASGADGVVDDTLGKNGGSVSLYAVNFPPNIIAVNTRGGNAFYQGTSTARGGSAGNVKITNSTVGIVNANGGNTVGNMNVGIPNGNIPGGIFGIITSINSTITSSTASQGLGYVSGCINSGYANFDPLATYDNGLCSNWEQSNSSKSRSWKSIASDASGTKLAAVVYGGYIYTSIDSGNTWVQKTSDATRNWYSIASDASGTKLAAVVNGGYIYTSTDSGNTWVQKTSDTTRSWNFITSDASGTKLAAVVSNGYIYTSIDSGNTWVQKTTGTARYWQSITSSADGTKLATVDFYGSNWSGGYIYTSSDSGNTWVQKTSSGARQWTSITSSADGTKLAAVVFGGYIYTSTDSGNTWVQKTSDATRSWNSITSSADGTKLAAVVNYSYVYTSSDSGNTWAQKTSDATRSWYSIASDASGAKLAAVVNDGYIYTYQNPYPTLSVNIILLQTSSDVSIWHPPVVSWGSANTCYYSYDNFNSMSTADCSSFGSDILPPATTGTSTLYVRGVDVNGVADEDLKYFTYSPYYWCGTVDSDWNNVNNWYTSSSCSINKGSLPGARNGVVLVGNISPIINAATTTFPFVINSNFLDEPARSVGVTFSENAYNKTVIVGNATYLSASSGVLTLTGSMKWTGSISGLIKGGDGVDVTNLIFNDSSVNETVFNGGVTFNDSSNNLGTINGNVTFNNTSPFTIGTVNGTVTLNGFSQVLNGVNNVTNFFKQVIGGVRDTLYLTSGSVLNISGLTTILGSDASNLLSIRTTTPGSSANLGINGSSTLNYLRIKDINNTGPTVDVTTKNVFDDGGSSGFTFAPNTTPMLRTSVTSSYVPPVIITNPTTPISPITPLNNNNTTNNRSSGGSLYNISNTSIGRLSLSNLPNISFAGFGKGSNLGVSNFINPLADLLKLQPITGFQPLPRINLQPKVNNFINSSLPKSLSDLSKAIPSIKKQLSSAGIVNGYDLYTMKDSPVNTPTLTDLIRDKVKQPNSLIFTSVDNKETRTKLSVDKLGRTYQMLTVEPYSLISINVKSNIKSTSPVVFDNIKVTPIKDKNNNITFSLKAPKDEGTKVLTVGNLTLEIRIKIIKSNNLLSQTKTEKELSPIVKLWRWFGK